MADCANVAAVDRHVTGYLKFLTKDPERHRIVS